MRIAFTERLVPRRVTGRMVLVSIVSFFAVIIAVNLIMATLAVSTFGGVETRNAYQAGLSFSREIAESRAQEARNWHVEAKLSNWTPDGVVVEVMPRDASSSPVVGVDFTVTFAHPASRRQDQVVSLSQVGAGLFRARTQISPGQWDLVVEAGRDGERLFRSKTRIQIR
jgi:nitrogen fixation protein FixH